jgi:hypothetical protein
VEEFFAVILKEDESKVTIKRLEYVTSFYVEMCGMYIGLDFEHNLEIAYFASYC